MTNQRDYDMPQVYSQMKFVEFLDFLGRVAIDYFDIVPNGPKELHYKVHEIIKLFWGTKPKPKKETWGAKGRDKGREKKVHHFPEIVVPDMEDPEDGDEEY